MSNFGFLQFQWPQLFVDAQKTESLVIPDPRTACFYARRTLELAVTWLYKSDSALKLPYQDNLSARIHEPTFKATVGQRIFIKAKLIKDLGNLAAHSHKPLQQLDSMTAVRELFHICFWLARTYGKAAKPADGLMFDPTLLPKTSPVSPQTLAQLQQLESQLVEKDTKLTELLTGKAALDAELERLRAEIAAIKKQNAETPDTHNYSEAETRDYFIDLLLKEAGWALDKQQDREYPITGMPNEKGEGFVDYVLWGDDGKPLGLVEAKRTKRDARVGQQQAKLYADCLEKQFGQRPVIFYSNGYEHWIWDDQNYPPRSVQGFYKKDELERLIQRRSTRANLGAAKIDEGIVERFYQQRAIRRIGEAFEKDHERKALVVMATGAGKTRTVIALCDLMMRYNWVKRVLFLADRIALVRQSKNGFTLYKAAYACTFPDAVRKLAAIAGIGNSVFDHKQLQRNRQERERREQAAEELRERERQERLLSRDLIHWLEKRERQISRRLTPCPQNQPLRASLVRTRTMLQRELVTYTLLCFGSADDKSAYTPSS